MTMRPIITLLTDFGTVDGYVGEMKGVLLSLASEAMIVDITHEIPAQDVDHARLTLARVWRRFPVGTIHIAVVDPGVGSSRRAIAVASNDHYFVGPDNGVLSPGLVMGGARIVELPIPVRASATFHGRDVFAPAAAAIAREALASLGGEVRDPVVRRTPEAHRDADGAITGEVIVVDRFGNAVTNLLGLRGGVVEVAGAVIPVRRTYAEANSGAPVAVVGSTGFIEIAVRDGDAARTLGLSRGAPVTLRTAR